jgi:diadenosine tetraphosphate (Ap4A) HIT family hydrolase
MKLTPEEQKKQEFYRDARFTDQYDQVWKTVGICAFCEPREKYIFYEENGVMMTISLYAYIDGHLLIVPRRHIRSVKELTPLEWETMRKFMYIAKKLIRKVHGEKGMQVVLKDGVTAQSTVTDHIHFHCVPFDAPDLSQWNYRKLKNTPLENAELYMQQAKKIAELDAKFDAKYKDGAV